jgi:hypothetical protein
MTLERSRRLGNKSSGRSPSATVADKSRVSIAGAMLLPAEFFREGTSLRRGRGRPHSEWHPAGSLKRWRCADSDDDAGADQIIFTTKCHPTSAVSRWRSLAPATSVSILVRRGWDLRREMAAIRTKCSVAVNSLASWWLVARRITSGDWLNALGQACPRRQ